MSYLAERAIVASMMKECCVEMKERWKVSLIWVLSCEERGGDVGLLWVLYGGCMGQRGDECRIT